MELHFTGRGAMLNPAEGNTAAYFEDDNNFFLIDCGEDVAAKLIKMGKLDQDKNYFLFVTHTHSDHIGSVGTLQQYLYWVRNKKLKVVFGSDMRYANNILDILNSFGLVQGTYDIVNTHMLNDFSPLFNRVRYMESSHGDTPLKSASLVFDTDEGNILYTGDIAEPRIIKDFLASNFPDTIDKMYIDTSLSKSPVHLSIEELRKVIPIGLSGKVYCMHIDNPALIAEIKKWGFNLVDSCDLNLLSRDINTLSQEELRTLENMLKATLTEVEGLTRQENHHTLKKIINHESQKRTYTN